MTAVALEIRLLDLSDLNAIESIERRAYPTPWSRAMFASELAKPTSISLGAFEGELLVGYAVNSRYVDAWHVMNVAVDPEHQGRGIARQLLERLFELTGRRPAPRLHPRGARLERRRDPSLRAGRLRAARHPPRLLRRQPGGRADHVARRQAARRDPRDRDVVRRDGGRARHARRGDPSPRVVASQDELHARFGGVVPEIASRAPPRARRARRRGGLARGEATLDDVELVAVTTRPGLIGALLVGLSAAKAVAWARRLPLAPVNHLHGHVASLYLKPLDLEPPFTCLLVSGGHTMLLDVAGARGVPRPRDDARRRGGRGVRQGRAPARPRLSRRRGDRRASPPAAIPRPTPSPSRAYPASTSRSRGSRRRSSTASATSPPPSSSPPRRPGRELPARDRPRARRAARGRRRRPHRRCRRRRGQLGASRGPAARRARAARALHRQRRDDRLGGPLHESRPIPRVPFTRCPRGGRLNDCWRSARRRSPSRSPSSGR